MSSTAAQNSTTSSAKQQFSTAAQARNGRKWNAPGEKRYPPFGAAAKVTKLDILLNKTDDLGRLITKADDLDFGKHVTIATASETTSAMDWLKNHLGAGGVTVSDEFTPTIQPADPIDGSSVTSDSVVVANTTDTVKHAFTATRDDLLNALGNAEKKLGEVGQNLHPAPELAGGGTLPPGTPLADALTRLFRTTDTSDTPRTNFGGGSGSIGFESRLSNGDVFSASLRGEILTVKDISVRNFEYIKRDRSEATQLRNEFDRRIRSNFLKNLARKEMDLRHLGFDDVDITDLRNGRLPDGYQVHHKHPLDDSGTNDFDNLILMKNQPYHKMMTNYQIEATRSLRVGEGRLVPWPEIPGDVYTGGQR